MKVPILLPNIFDHPFTYKNTFSTPIEPGEFVKVSFGAKEQTGVVWDFEQKTKKKIKLKKILKKIDVPKINLTMIKFIKWFAKYNMVSLGMSLRMSLLSGDAVDKKFDEEFKKFIILKKKNKFQLNQEQNRSLDLLKKFGNNYNVSLLEGVTGSGKTLVYFQRIKDIILKWPSGPCYVTRNCFDRSV